jgi:hypothetical protein
MAGEIERRVETTPHTFLIFLFQKTTHNEEAAGHTNLNRGEMTK